MDEICRDIFLEITKSEKLINFFEICGLIDYNDIIKVNEDTLEIMEKYISNYLSQDSKKNQQNEKKEEEYIGEGFLLKKDKFIFSPGMKIRIFRTIETLENEYKNCKLQNNDTNYSIIPLKTEFKNNNNELSLINPEKKSIENVNNNNNNFTIKNEEKSQYLNKIHLLDSSRNFISTNIDLGSKKQILDAWAPNAIERIEKNFNVRLKYKEDFELDMQLQSSEQRITGIFICHLCRALRGESKCIKFAISRASHVILSNVMTHLKVHFPLGNKSSSRHTF